MNLQATLDHQPIKLTVSSFLMLRGFGAFDEYWKAELLDGELWGVPADGDEEPESDATSPIRLTIEHYELLAKAGAFDEYANGAYRWAGISIESAAATARLRQGSDRLSAAACSGGVGLAAPRRHRTVDGNRSVQ